MTDAHIQSALDGGVLTLTLNRPEKKNALTVAMYERLAEEIRGVGDRPEVRVVALAAAGDAFTSGNDLMDFKDTPPAGMDSPVIRFLLSLVGCEKPVVAAVNGAAIGIGTTLLLHADLVYAAESATFQLPFVNLGLCPEGASSFLLPRMMGHPRAAELLLLGERFSAGVAQEVGLVTRLVEDDALSATLAERARALAKKPAASVRATKDLLRRGTRAQVRRALEEEGALFMQRLASPEAAEAFSAFFEKRSPDFSRFD